MPASTRVELTTSDGVVLSALHWDSGGGPPGSEDEGPPGSEDGGPPGSEDGGPPGSEGLAAGGVAAGGVRDLGCVVAHGFTGSASKPHVRAICVALRERGFGVIAPDMRGHGSSGGLCTAGADERLDVAAAADWLRARGYQRVAVLGWSMGGSAVLRYAGLGGVADAVVSVSSPGRWFERGTRPMRIVHWMCETRTGRLATRLVRRTRIAGAAWDAKLPEAPAEVAGLISPTPLLIVHGEADHYFPVGHFEALAEAAPEADHWLEPGMGHAETATTPELLARIADWLAAAVRTGPPGVCDDGSRE